MERVTLYYFLILFVLWGIASLIPAALAKWRGRSPIGWFFFSLLVSPLLTSVVLLFEAVFDQETGKDVRVKCRECGSLSMEDATYCSSCGAEL